MKIKYKLTILLVAIAILPILVLSIISTMDTTNILTDNALLESQNEVLGISNQIENFLSNAEGDVLFMSELQNLNGLINAQTEQDQVMYKEYLQKDIYEFSKNREIYYQARYLDETGQEIIRVDSKDGILTIKSEEELQNKAGRYYFDDSFKINKGDVFVSPLDLNIERGAVENRGSEDNPEYVPVIRYATPVKDKLGMKKGIVLTNIYADKFLDELNANKDLILVNKDGFYLHHQDKGKEWGWMLENDNSIHKDYPEIASKIFDDESGQLSLVDSVISYVRINPGGSEFWILVSIKDKNVLLSPASKARNKALIIGVVTALLVVLLGFIISGSVTKPLNLLTSVTNKISKGNLKVKIPEIKSDDEIHDLGESMKGVLAAVEFLTDEVKKKGGKKGG